MLAHGAFTGWFSACAPARLRQPRTGPGAGGVAIAGTPGSDAPATTPSRGRWSRARQRGNPSHAAILRPAWHAHLAAKVCPGPGLVPLHSRPWVRSGVVTVDLDDTV